MSWTCEEVLAKLGSEAQITARGIVMLVDAVTPDGGPTKKHLLVAEFQGDTFQLTQEGKAYLQPVEAVEEAKKPTRGLKKKPDPVVAVDADDLDLD